MNEDGAVPETGERESQVAVVVTLHSIVPVPELEMVTVCAAGSLPPAVAEKARLVGLRLIVAAGVAGKMVKVTGMDNGVLVSTMVTVTVVE